MALKAPSLLILAIFVAPAFHADNTGKTEALNVQALLRPVSLTRR